MPEIVTVDEAMGEPEGDVMWVVALFARDVFFKREVAGDVGAAWADERIEAGNLLVGPEDGDELVAIFDFNGLIDLLQSELAGSRENESESEG
jgi:hypothetical protein|tara:strand:+ start:195 stop:473 length:279 start_codon:yes stop_codon:yes gene_type:complete